MKKKIFLLLFQYSIINIHYSFAQAGEWTWMHGSNVANSAGSFGTQGIPSPTNTPPSFYEPCEFTDVNGNFWLFGGYRGGTNYGDLWKYNIATNDWTWMRGTAAPNDPGNYGTQGVSAPTNYPPARSYGAVSWCDNTNNLWLFGGTFGGGAHNDLWRYNISTNEWTWMKGADTANPPGVYNTQGLPDTSNTPGGRWEVSAAWTANSGDLFLFGGFKGGVNSYNDLWRYTIATNTWTWMKGDSITSQVGVFGTQGVEAPGNSPGSRMAFSHWKDNNGNFWLFAGTYYNGFDLNDLWRYNPITNNWAWIGGSNTFNDAGAHGTKCVSSPANLPQARKENRAVWNDAQGNFWFFGGVTMNAATVWNDLWKYCVATNQWIWISGDSTFNGLGNWGTLGVSSPTNIPIARTGSVGWTKGNNELYLFGGSATPFLTPYNDLWRYVIDTTCGVCGIPVAPVALFAVSDTTICANECVDYTDMSSGATSWQWIFTGGNPTTSTAQNPSGVCYDTSGVYNVTLIAANSAGSDTITFTNYITVIAAPVVPVLTQIGDTLFSSGGYTSYQWYFGSDTIVGATNYFYVATQSGNYNVAVTNENGCSVGAGVVNVVAEMFEVSGLRFEVYPNPANEELYVTCYTLYEGDIHLEIFNSLGKKVFSTITNARQETVNCKPFANGIYLLKITFENPLGRTGRKIITTKFVVSK